MVTSIRRYAPGFTLLNGLVKKRKYPVAIATVVEIGDLVILTNGYLALGTTLQSVTPVVAGVANSRNTAAEAVANGTIVAEVVPLLMEYDWIVPCEDDAVLVQTDVGTLRDLQSEDGIDNGDTVTAGRGFFIDEIDVSSAALAVQANGFAIGHFEETWAS
jgi:hypothetical protein